MQATRTGIPIALRLFDRIEGVAGLPGVVALAQAHDTATAKIQRGNDFKSHRERKFFNNKAPTAAERSGWNCMPQKLR